MAGLISRRAVLAGGASLLAGGLPLAGAAGSISDMTNPNARSNPAYTPFYARALEYRTSVVQVAAGYNGQTVGGGECTDFVQEVLNKLQFPNHDTTWGVPIDWIDFGVILQLYKAKFTSPDGSSFFYTDTQHTAIVTNWSYDTKVARVIHQNWGVRKVKVDDLNLGWPHTGRMEIWLPWR